MTYEEALTFLYSQLPMFTRDGAAAYKADLTNTIALCEAFDNPQHKFRSIHIAGTNGKGSTASMLAAIFTKAGFKTGLYTSPHIKQFEERIRINGSMISKEAVTSFVERSIDLCAEIQPSFFELTVAMAFEYFANEKVDIAIIECGLGGRLDSTNVITPILSIITNIGFDHMDLLGNTIEAISTEKAGIIKKKVPVIIGRASETSTRVFNAKAEKETAAIFYATDIYQFLQEDKEGTFSYFYRPSNQTVQVRSALRGQYQRENIATVLTAVEVINMATEFTFTDQKIIAQALLEVAELTGLSARWEEISSNPTVIYDVGHNEDGMLQITSQLKKEFSSTKKHIILGFVKDKVLDNVLTLLPKEATYYFTNANIPRALLAADLAALGKQQNLIGEVYPTPLLALKAAHKAAGEEDLILVCGSFFIMSELPTKESFNEVMGR